MTTPTLRTGDALPVSQPTHHARVSALEKRLNEVEKDWLTKADKVPPLERENYKAKVRHFMNELRTQIAEARSCAHRALELSSRMNQIINTYDTQLQAHYTHNEEFGRNMRKVQERNFSIGATLRQMNPDLAAFQQKPSSRARPVVNEPHPSQLTMLTGYEQITKIEQQWYKKAERLPPDERKEYCDAVSRYVGDLNKQVPLFKDTDPRLLERVIQENAKIYDRCLERNFPPPSLYSTFLEPKAGQRPTQPSGPKENEKPSSFFGDIMKYKAADKAMETVVTAEVYGTVFRIAGEVIAAPVRAVCQSSASVAAFEQKRMEKLAARGYLTPMDRVANMISVAAVTDKVCRKVANFATTSKHVVKSSGAFVLGATGGKEFVKHFLYGKRHALPSKLMELGVPKDQVDRFGHDVATIRSTAVGVSAVGLLYKTIFSLSSLRSSFFEMPMGKKITQFIGDESGSVRLPSLQRTPKIQDPRAGFTATRVNQAADRHLYFPTIAEINESGLPEIHKIWSRNQETLTGILAEENLPRFGFHGTDVEGIRGILSTQLSRSVKGDFVWVAGFRYPVNPVAQLADLLTMARKAFTYTKGKGGVFVVDTTTAVPYGQSFTAPVTGLPLDKAVHKRVFSLMERDGKGPWMTTTPDGRMAVAEEAFLNVGEYHVHFNPETFGNIVKGLIWDKETLYPPMKAWTQRSEKGKLIWRFETQEFVTAALEKVGVIEDLLKAPWWQYQQVGQELMHLPKRAMAVPLDEFIQMERQFAKGEVPFRQFSPQHYSSEQIARAPITHRKAINSDDIGNLSEVILHGYVSSHRGDMVLQLLNLECPQGVISPTSVMNQFKRFAEHHGAKRLFLELDLNSDVRLAKMGRKWPPNDSLRDMCPEHFIEREFSEWIARSSALLRRECLGTPLMSNQSSYIFEIPLSPPQF
jgi:hypothetical protein